MAAEHVMYLDRDFATDDWCVACSCGWESKTIRHSRMAAQDDFDNHCDVVFMEATGG